MRRALSCGSAGNFEAKIEMKILLSTPGTIAMARRAASAVHAVGSESQSIPRQLDEPGSCPPTLMRSRSLRDHPASRTSRAMTTRDTGINVSLRRCWCAVQAL